MGNITNAGMAEVAALICADQASGHTAFDYLGFGTGTNAFNVTDTALQTQSGSRIAATGTLITVTVTNDTMQLVGTYTAGGTVAITEAGIFNAATAGTMLARWVFSARNLDLNETLQLTAKVTIKQGT